MYVSYNQANFWQTTKLKSLHSMTVCLHQNEHRNVRIYTWPAYQYAPLYLNVCNIMKMYLYLHPGCTRLTAIHPINNEITEECQQILNL